MHLGRYNNALTRILSALGRLLRAIRSLKGGVSLSENPTAGQQARNNRLRRGGGEDKPLPGTGDGRFRFEEVLEPTLRALRPEALADLLTEFTAEKIMPQTAILKNFQSWHKLCRYYN